MQYSPVRTPQLVETNEKTTTNNIHINAIMFYTTMSSARRQVATFTCLLALLLQLLIQVQAWIPSTTTTGSFLLTGWHSHPSASSYSSSRSCTNRRLAQGALQASTTVVQASSKTTVVELSYTEWTLPAVAELDQQDPPVVFLHGLLGNKKNFASLARSLARQLTTQRRIFGLDMRNHGDNVRVCDDMSYRNMAADVVQFLNALGLDQVVLVGHSMGGKIAQAVALRHAERVQGLIVLDMAPVTYAEHDDSTWQTVCSIVRRLEQVGTDASSLSDKDDQTLTRKQVDLALRADIPDPALRAFCLTNWGDNGQWKIPMQIITQQLPTLAAFDIVDDDDGDDDREGELSYTGDAFFIHGGQSRFVRHSHLPTIRQYFPNHMLTTIRGCGHWVHAEAPEDTLSLLLQFLDR